MIWYFPNPIRSRLSSPYNPLPGSSHSPSFPNRSWSFCIRALMLLDAFGDLVGRLDLLVLIKGAGEGLGSPPLVLLLSIQASGYRAGLHGQVTRRYPRPAARSPCPAWRCRATGLPFSGLSSRPRPAGAFHGDLVVCSEPRRPAPGFCRRVSAPGLQPPLIGSGPDTPRRPGRSAPGRAR